MTDEELGKAIHRMLFAFTAAGQSYPDTAEGVTRQNGRLADLGAAVRDVMRGAIEMPLSKEQVAQIGNWVLDMPIDALRPAPTAERKEP